jgi:hypothetical protein
LTRPSKTHTIRIPLFAWGADDLSILNTRQAHNPQTESILKWQRESKA